MSHGMDDLLNKEWDVILIGTDCIQAVLAASLARAGKSVLHLDENAYYGGDMVSHTFTDMLEWAGANTASAVEETVVEHWNAVANTTAAPAPPAATAAAGDAAATPPPNKNTVPMLRAAAPRQRTFSVSRLSCAAVNGMLVAPRAVAAGDPVVVFAPDPVTGAPKPPPPPRRGWGPPPPPPPRPEFCRGALRALNPETRMAAVEVRGWAMADGTVPVLHVHADQLAHEKDFDPALLTDEERAMGE
jgi:hypothetical protein